MHLADRFARLAPAGGHTLRHLRVLEQETQQLAGRVAGAADDGRLHCELRVASRESRVESVEAGLVTGDS
jgi:hypothetical protein